MPDTKMTGSLTLSKDRNSCIKAAKRLKCEPCYAVVKALTELRTICSADAEDTEEGEISVEVWGNAKNPEDIKKVLDRISPLATDLSIVCTDDQDNLIAFSKSDTGHIRAIAA